MAGRSDEMKQRIARYYELGAIGVDERNELEQMLALGMRDEVKERLDAAKKWLPTPTERASAAREMA
jgi:hypothetical protein